MDGLNYEYLRVIDHENRLRVRLKTRPSPTAKPSITPRIYTHSNLGTLTRPIRRISHLTSGLGLQLI